MRRLAVQTGTTNFLLPQSDLLKIYIPANWWADGHEVLWRLYFTYNDHGIIAPVGATVNERCIANQGGAGITLNEVPAPFILNLVQSCISRRMVRQGSNILFWDDDFNQGTYGIMGVVQGVAGIIVPPPAGGWDFAQEIIFTWRAVPVGATWNTTITVDNAIALIAPPLNLRT